MNLKLSAKPFALVCSSLLGLLACAPLPASAPSRALQSQTVSNRVQNPALPSTLNEKQYLELTVQTLKDELNQGSEAGLQAYLDWGRTQPEYFAGSRNAIGQQILPLLRSRKNSNRVAEVEALLQTPVKAIATEAYKPIDFRVDQGVHNNKLAEWWYYTGHLNTPDGRPYGYEICYFRVSPVILFAHAAVTDERNQAFTYERNFYLPGHTHIAAEKANIRYGSLISEQTGPNDFKLNLPIGGKFKLNLQLHQEKQPLIINGNGLIDMPEGTDSYYYSLTRMKTVGTLEAEGKSLPVSGQSWMDHQWGNFVALRIGWDWFSFQMEDGSEYNLFGFRKRNGEKLERYVNALIGDKPLQGRDFRIDRLQWWRSPKTNKLYVTRWRVTLPQTNEVFEIEAVQPDQEVAATKPYDIAPTYWEGRSRITKIKPDGTRVQGLGYTEHFDYTTQVASD